MKVQIIHLEEHDDLSSARDKLGWVKAPRALFVWPEFGTPIRRQLDLVLLKRRASELNLQLGLVTHDPQVRDHARQIGMPVFESVEALSESGWRRSRAERRRSQSRRQPRPLSPPPLQDSGSGTESTGHRNRIIALLLVAIAWTALAGILLPWAEIVVAPETETRQVAVDLILAPSTSLDTPPGQVPARRLTIEVEGSRQAATTGRVAIPSTRAGGAAQLTNLTAEAILVPAGSGLRPSDPAGPRFRTLETVELPEGEGATVEVRIEAVEPGSEGNLAAGQLTSLEGPLGLQMRVTNLQPIRGGGEAFHLGVSAADAAALETALWEELEARALQGLAELLEEDEQLSAESLRVFGNPRLQFDRAVGEASGRLSLTMHASFEALAYRAEAYEAALDGVLEADRRVESKSVPGSLQLEVGAVRWLPAGGLSVELLGTEQIYASPPLPAIQRSLRWTPASSVSGTLRDHYSLGLAQARLFPGWLPRLPLLGGRIQILLPWETGN